MKGQPQALQIVKKVGYLPIPCLRDSTFFLQLPENESVE